MTNRRDFLKGLGLASAACTIHFTVPEIVWATKGALPAGEWVYDAAHGVFLNPVLTQAILDAKRIKLVAPTDRFITTSLAKRRGLHEFYVYEFVPPWMQLAESAEFCLALAKHMDQLADTTRWHVLELRATIPSDFGRTRAVAWYGWRTI